MLTENGVVIAVSSELERRGWTIAGQSFTTQRGVDVTATKGDRTLLVEAKGEGSSQVHTALYGQAFKRGQVCTHVAAAVMTALKVVAEGRHLAAIAIPDSTTTVSALGPSSGHFSASA